MGGSYKGKCESKVKEEWGTWKALRVGFIGNIFLMVQTDFKCCLIIYTMQCFVGLILNSLLLFYFFLLLFFFLFCLLICNKFGFGFGLEGRMCYIFRRTPHLGTGVVCRLVWRSSGCLPLVKRLPTTTINSDTLSIVQETFILCSTGQFWMISC